MAAVPYIYRGGGRDDIPDEATHVSIHESVTVIPERLFYKHPNIIELICHIGVEKIESEAFLGCPCLKRVIIPGVVDVGQSAFCECKAMNYIECPKLERIRQSAFRSCESLKSIDLPSAMIVERLAFSSCKLLSYVNFTKNLMLIGEMVFIGCRSLERITIPLKNGLFHEAGRDVFRGCESLTEVNLVEGLALKNTIATLQLQEWRNDITEKVESINQILPITFTGYFDFENTTVIDGEKTIAIQRWVASVLEMIVDYKAKNRRILSEVATTLRLVSSNDIVTNSVLPFLEMPSHTFNGEEENGMDGEFEDEVEEDATGERGENQDEYEDEDMMTDGRKRRRL